MKFKYRPVNTENSFSRKNKDAVIFKIGCFDNIDSAVIISSESKAARKVKNCLAYTIDDNSGIYVAETPSFDKKFPADFYFSKVDRQVTVT